MLAALDAASGVPVLERILVKAREENDAPVEVFACDALARSAAVDGELDTARQLLAEADSRMPAASHFVSERDRVDATHVRLLIS